MEQFQDTMLGSFASSSNMFKKKCGIIIGDDGIIRLDLAPVPGCVSGEAKAERKKAKRLDKGRGNDVPDVPIGSVAGGVTYDGNYVVYTRREDRNAKRFVTLPRTALNLWPTVMIRVAIDLDAGITVAHELARGCSKSGL